ncbi:rhamnulokinase family protein [Lachnospiraceae bacterium 29-91]
MRKKHVAAVDLGASSGRVILVTFYQNQLELEEIHRFTNEGIHAGERLYTDILYIFREILTGIKKLNQRGKRIDAIGIDSWGVDFAVLDKRDELVGNPYHYRDIQTEKTLEQARQIFGERGLFHETGIQDMWYNTIYQILGIQNRNKDYFRNAQCILMIPDILGYFLTGNKQIEYTSASTTQIYNLKQKKWSENILYELGLEDQLFPEVLMTGTPKGYLTDTVKKLTGMVEENNPVLIATAGHDSASAAYAVPASEEKYVFINSGTWSIIGMVMDEPVVTDEIYEKGYSNEGAAFGKVKLVQSIMGMWLIQELRKSWERQGKRIDYGYLTAEAEQADAFTHMINVDDVLFASPLDMEEAVSQYCIRTGQTEMHGQGELYRTVMESLAMRYREAVNDLEKITGEKVDILYLLGGAVQDRAFCQYIANATGKRVSAGPVEATAIGNAMIQLKALGVLTDEDSRAKLLCRSFSIECYDPKETEVWDKMYEKYRKIVNRRP